MLLEQFGVGEWPWIVQGMFPHLPLTVQFSIGDGAELPLEIDDMGIITRHAEASE